MRALIYENKNDEYNAHLNWGKYNLARGDKDIAINEYLNAFQLKNDDINLLNSLAALLEETGDVNHAMEFYERISKIDKTDRNALEKLADFRESIGDYGVQSDYLEKLYELNPRNSSVALKLAQTYEKLRNKPDAIKYYNVYLEIGKGTPDYAKVKSKLEKLNNTEMKEDEGLIGVIMKLFGK